VTDELLISERPAEVDDRALGRRSDPRYQPISDRHAGGALKPVHDAVASPADRRSQHPQNDGRAGDHGCRRQRGSLRDRGHDRDPPGTAAAIVDLGPGIEMAQHVQLQVDSGLEIYFCDPRSPWQRATNENTNRLLRQYFPEAPTSRVTAPRTSQPSRRRSTVDHARYSRGGHPPRCSPNTSAPPPDRPQHPARVTCRTVGSLVPRGGSDGRARLSPFRPALRASPHDYSRIPKDEPSRRSHS
jgi:hypothetical protein